MAMPMRVTGGWIQLLTDWLDLYQFPAPDLRLLLDSRRQDEAVPLALWQQLLERASMLPATAVVPALEIGAQVRPRHVGVLGYLSLASHTLGEALQVYQRYEQLFYGQQLGRVRVQDELVVLCWDADASTGASADTVAIAALVSFLRRLLPEVSAVARVGFVFPAPDARSRAAYDAFLAVRSYLTLPLPRSHCQSVGWPADCRTVIRTCASSWINRPGLCCWRCLERMPLIAHCSGRWCVGYRRVRLG